MNPTVTNTVNEFHYPFMVRYGFFMQWQPYFIRAQLDLMHRLSAPLTAIFWDNDSKRFVDLQDLRDSADLNIILFHLNFEGRQACPYNHKVKCWTNAWNFGTDVIDLTFSECGYARYKQGNNIWTDIPYTERNEKV